VGILDLLKKPAATPEVSVQKRKVLVVDDERDLREFYEDLLTRQGYEVVTATNGQEALAAVTQHAPELILLDIMMPVMDGLEVLRALNDNEQTKKIPVIVLTNAGNMDNMDQANFYSAYKFFVKVNVAPEEIIKTVADALATVKQPAPVIPVSS
jgi:CheY-like chemotaxis protein